MPEEPRSHPREFGGSLYGKMVAKVDRAYREWRELLGPPADNLYDRPPAKDEIELSKLYGRIEGACALLGIFRGNDTKTQLALAKERYDAR